MATGSTLSLAIPPSPALPVEGDRLTFHWTTDAPDAKNWVGIYDGDRRPGTGSSLLWKYTPAGSGDVQLDTSALTGGPYTAYLLAKDGYGVLAQTAPFTFRPKPAVVRPHAAVDALTATPVAPGAAVSVRLGGLWSRPAGNPPGSAAFRKISGPAWLAVGADGTVTGTAPAGRPARDPELLVVGVKDGAGATDTVTVQVPVADPAGPLRLKTASWNLADAGAAFTDAVEKQLRVVLAQGLDVLGLQETAGSAARTLADALGWHAYQSPGSVGILSRYPLTAVTPPTADVPAAGATLQLPGGRTVRFWAAHLDESDYGPYAVQDGRTAAQVVAAENGSLRLRQAKALAAALAADAAAGVPVVLAGALASPSHLDWTAATAAAHGGAGPVAWPVTTALQAAGLTDTFREEYRDPAKAAGVTWSPTRRQRAAGKAEPQDRIDYVLHRGPLKLVEAHTLVADWPATGTDPAALAANQWPSDAAAAVATFQL
ncbi:endonuclease/exonuclease/phosphatase family protein [Streptomyces sp. BE20]|uniref:endonuclease/exonuclease/phosphatase family protein n=1 Tax=Streptomyces sp. BE20 TaxID=3002525 RepID=UPI002E79D786|nr:endonuclease/exonuclease/phosphatase family protein [Streptomyces sp. BE20]MEE1825018.1 endonuclease/exonuclease/phosphatase family protein [Streptomyces sp. BE20]